MAHTNVSVLQRAKARLATEKVPVPICDGGACGSHLRAGVGEGTGYFSRAGLAMGRWLAKRCRCGTTVE